MREIGRTMQEEQGLTLGDITWLVGIARAILRAFTWDEGPPMRATAGELGISPQTLYTKLRQAVQALMLVRRGIPSVQGLLDRIQELQGQLARVEEACAAVRAEVQRLTKALAEAQAQVVALQFAFYHNLHTLRAGNSFLAAARVDVVQLFGADDLYTILGFPPASHAFTPVKSVQSQAA